MKRMFLFLVVLLFLAVLFIVCFLIYKNRLNFEWLFEGDHRLTVKVTSVSGASVIHTQFLPFVFDDDSTGIVTYQDPDYGLEILSIVISGVPLEPISGSGKTSLFGEKDTEFVKIPFVWLLPLSGSFIPNERGSGATQLIVCPPAGVGYTYRFNVFDCKDEIEIVYKLRSAGGAKSGCRYKLIIDCRSLEKLTQ